MLEITEQIKELQAMEDMSKQEKQRADKWDLEYLDLEKYYFKALKVSIGYWERANKSKSQMNEMAQAIEEAAKKAHKDAEEIKELQDTNEILLNKYQENERHLQRFFTRETPSAPPPTLPTSKKRFFRSKLISFKMSSSKSS